MKILFVNDRDWYGGAELRVHQIAEFMEKKDHEVYLAVSETSREEVLKIPVKQSRKIFGRTCFFWNVKDPLAYDATKKILKKLKPDVISFHDIYRMTLAPLLAAKKYQVPRLTTIHCYWPVCPTINLLKRDDTICMERNWSKCSPQCSKRKSWVIRYEMNARRKVLRQEKLVAQSNAVKKALVRFGYDKEKIQIINPGTELDFFKPSLIHSNMILWVAADLSRHKGPEYFIKAAQIVKKEHPQVRFLMVGEPKPGKIYETQAVEFVGRLSRNVLREYYANALALVVTSICPDPSPLVTFEAMACGKPVVAFANGGLKEAILNGQTGFLVGSKNYVKLAEKISLLLREQALAIEMGKRARRHVETHYPIEKMLKSYEEQYEQLCKR